MERPAQQAEQIAMPLVLVVKLEKIDGDRNANCRGVIQQPGGSILTSFSMVRSRAQALGERSPSASSCGGHCLHRGCRNLRGMVAALINNPAGPYPPPLVAKLGVRRKIISLFHLLVKMRFLRTVPDSYVRRRIGCRVGVLGVTGATLQPHNFCRGVCDLPYPFTGVCA